MGFDWHLFKTEIGLIALALSCLILDIFIPPDEKRGKTLASIAMIGVALLFGHLLSQWGVFGTALGGSFSQDGIAFFFKGAFLVSGFFALFMAREYQSKLKRGHGEFILLILFSLVGMMFLASANDFLLFFIALETLTVSLYIMTAYLRDKSASIEAGVKYLILGALSTALLLYGVSFIYGAVGSTSYWEIHRQISEAGQLPLAFIFGLILVICSLGFKIAAVPFHLWAPDIYEGAPTPVTAYLSIGSKVAGFAALIRLMLTVFAPAAGILTLLFSVLAALTILYGNLGAIPQTNIKRLLGYSSIGHSGYLLIGFAAFARSGNEAILFYLMSYIVSAAGAFLVIVAVSQTFKTDEISEYAGLSTRSPLLAASMLISLLSLAGVPPLAGFFGKFYLLLAGMKAGLIWLVVIGVLNVITSLYYYLKVVKVMYVDKPVTDTPLDLHFDQKVIQYLCILGILALGIYQGPFVRLAQAAFVHFPQ
jgi:NADH-quinone oxidoreductase subunit N